MGKLVLAKRTHLEEVIYHLQISFRSLIDKATECKMTLTLKDLFVSDKFLIAYMFVQKFKNWSEFAVSRYI